MTHSRLEVSTYNEGIEQLLREYFAFFPEDEPRLQVLAQQVADANSQLCDRKTLPGHLTGAALVLRRHEIQDQVLLIHHKTLQRWLQPGGHLDPGEHPQDGAQRELLEEAGLAVKLHNWHAAHPMPLDIDSHPIPANAAKNEPQHLHHDWMYVYAADPACAVTLQQDEVSHFGWVPLADLLTGKYGSRLQRACQKIYRLGLCGELKEQA